MQPAWAIKFQIKAVRGAAPANGWRWTGRLEADGFLLEEPHGGAGPLVLGTATVTSWQPYREDALVDAKRAAGDLGAVIGVGMGGLAVEVESQPVSADALSGAKRWEGSRITDSTSYSLRQDLQGHAEWLSAVKLMESDPVLRADADTFQLAKTQTDPTARFIHLYRIYDRYARELLAQVDALVDPSERTAIVDRALATETLNRLSEDSRKRLRGTLETSLSRLKAGSRLDVLEAHFAAAPYTGCAVDREFLGRLDSVRGSVAHNPTVSNSAIDPAVTAKLFQLVHQILKDKLQLR